MKKVINAYFIDWIAAPIYELEGGEMRFPILIKDTLKWKSEAGIRAYYDYENIPIHDSWVELFERFKK
jgi:hypothetical protein